MTTGGAWVGYVVTHPGDTKGAWIDLDRSLDPEPWFAVPRDHRIFDVGVQTSSDRGSADQGSGTRSHDLSWSVPRTPPALFDRSLFGGEPMWPGYPDLLCRATRLAVLLWTERSGPFSVDAPLVAESLTSLVGEHQIGETAQAAAAWIGRVLERFLGDAPSVPDDPKTPMSASVVAHARALHLHVVQICGVDPAPDRLAAERDLYRLLSAS